MPKTVSNVIAGEALPPLFKYTTFDPISSRGDFWKIMQQAPLCKPPSTPTPWLGLLLVLAKSPVKQVNWSQLMVTEGNLHISVS